MAIQPGRTPLLCQPWLDSLAPLDSRISLKPETCRQREHCMTCDLDYIVTAANQVKARESL